MKNSLRLRYSRSSPYFSCIYFFRGFFTNTSSVQDPANPKPKKRKERADDKVALTEKVVAKARAEKESTKKAKTDVSVEVNRPRVGSGAEEMDISLHVSDFVPVSIAIYTPRSTLSGPGGN